MTEALLVRSGSRSHHGKNIIGWPRPELLVTIVASGLALCAEFVFAQPALEYRVKAGFLYHFAAFVSRPEDRVRAGAPLTIGILGEDPFGGALEEAVRGKSIDGRRLAVRRLASSDEIAGLDIVFVSASEDERIDRFLRAISRLPILTVGETDRFEDFGGIVRFSVEDRQVRLRVNLSAAGRARLKLSSKFLSVARVTGARH